MSRFLRTLFGKRHHPPSVHSPASEADPVDTAVIGMEAAVGESRPEPIHVTDDTFEDLVMNASSPALVDFWAPWCGPCRMIAPIVEDLAKAYDGRLVIAKINTDDNCKVASELGITGIPTLVLFKEGQEVDRVVGYAPRHSLEEKLRTLLD